MSNEKETAVDWLIREIEKSYVGFYGYESLYEKAKAKEKEQIMRAYNKSFELRDKPYATSDKYYKETYEK